MEDYYQILEVSPQANFAEIKSAYRLLCKEYHPDKLPPGTPEKARQYIEERFKLINQAYSTLSNQLERQEYDANFHNVKPPQPKTEPKPSSYTSSSYSDIFDSERLKQVADQLEATKQQIEIQYEIIERQINQSVKRQLQLLGYKQEYLKGETLLSKIGIFALAILNAIAGLWFMGLANANIIFALIGAAWAGYWLIYGIVVVFTYSTLNKRIAKQVKLIREQADLDKHQAKQERDRQLNNFYLTQRQRIDFFKYIPITIISDDYISALSDEDQFYLLQAICERNDREKLNKNLQIAVAVIAQLGILAVLFGLGGNRF